MDEAEYCRQVESHLCRKNDGHVIRLVGPSFELVCGWVATGIPLKIALHGIDRHFLRLRAQGPRRRPVRVASCAPDVLDVFDEWRRAVGVFLPGSGEPGDSGEEASGRRRQSLATHLDRVTGRLVARPTDPNTPLLNDAVSDAIGELDRWRGAAAKVRGGARAEIARGLAAIDRTLVAAARASVRAAELDVLSRDAAVEIAPFRERMAADVYRQALDSAAARLLRERLDLPIVSYE